MVAELAVVGDVGVAEEKVVRADAGGQFLEGAAVNGGILPEHIRVSDLERGGLAGVFEVLRFPADRGEGEEFIVFPEGGSAFENDMRMEDTIIPEGHVLANDGIGAHADVLSELGLGGNDGGRMDHCTDSKRTTGL